MATEKRLIDALDTERPAHPKTHYDMGYNNGLTMAIAIAQKMGAMEVPCKIGDFVWAIRNFKGRRHPQRGIVSDMFFTKDMKLMIVVKYVARGEWGKTVFATDKEAYAAICAKMDGDGNG